jgi:hypothetical protein
MVFKLNNPMENERRLSQSVIQVTEILGMYNAELARILGLQCGDIGELTSGKRCIKQNSEAWQRGALFIETYHQLFDYFEGDGVTMYHWMRAHNKQLDGTPHFLIVDDGKLQIIHDYLYRANLNKSA